MCLLMSDLQSEPIGLFLIIRFDAEITIKSVTNQNNSQQPIRFLCWGVVKYSFKQIIYALIGESEDGDRGSHYLTIYI